MSINDAQDSQPYHHGNVKEALIHAALKFIEEDEVELISLRRLSREVGVTPSAVYNHFADKNALMLAIKIRIYGKFNEYFESKTTKTSDPEEALLETCMSYYYFSKEYPSQFQFLFSSTLPLEWSTPEAVAVFCKGVVQARQLVFNIYQKYQINCSEEDIVYATLLIWSQLHGIVMLRNSGSIQAAVAYQGWPMSCALSKDEEVEALIRKRVEMMVNGIFESQNLKGPH